MLRVNCLWDKSLCVNFSGEKLQGQVAGTSPLVCANLYLIPSSYVITRTRLQAVFGSDKLSIAYSEDPLFVYMIILSIQTHHLVVTATYFAQTKVYYRQFVH